MLFNIDKEIFDYFPGMKIVCVTARDIGGTVNSEAIDALLTAGWKSAGQAAAQYGNAQSHPNVLPWVEHMKAAGAPRKKFPSSIEALLKRAGKGGEPFRLMPAVDFYNAISLAYIVPAGGFDIDTLANGLELRLSREGDTFQALDSEAEEAVPPGEICYADGSSVVTRHFVWKQSKHALLTPESRNIFFVSEIPGELPQGTAEMVEKAFVDGLKNCFGVSASSQIVGAESASIEIT